MVARSKAAIATRWQCCGGGGGGDTNSQMTGWDDHDGHWSPVGRLRRPRAHARLRVAPVVVRRYGASEGEVERLNV